MIDTNLLRILKEVIPHIIYNLLGIKVYLTKVGSVSPDILEGEGAFVILSGELKGKAYMKLSDRFRYEFIDYIEKNYGVEFSSLDLLKELSNQITGNLITHLSEVGFNADIEEAFCGKWEKEESKLENLVIFSIFTQWGLLFFAMSIDKELRVLRRF